MKRIFILAATVMSLITGGAMAADMPVKTHVAPPPVYTWTGCYVSAGGGYGLYDVSHYGVGATNQTLFEDMSSGGKGGLITVGVGCDYQFAQSWVIGAFGEYDWMKLRGDHGWQCIVANGCSFNGGAGSTAGTTAGLREKSAWYAGARFGYAVTPTVLSYVSIGYTATRFDAVNILQPRLGAGTPTSDTGAVIAAQTYSGIFVGGGTEIAIGWLPGLTWKNEYRYAKYSTRDAPINCAVAPLANGCAAVGPTGMVDRMSPVVQTVRTELVYRFGGSAVVAKY